MHERVKESVGKKGISMNQLITSVVLEKTSAFATKESLKKRARRSNKTKFKEALFQIPYVEPEKYDY